MNINEIAQTVNSLKTGDQVMVNQWEQPMTVVGVSERFALCHNHESKEYSIISKEPAPDGYCYNGVVEGDYYCGPDFWIMGYWDGYHFDEQEWVKKYLSSLETNETEISMRNRVTINMIQVIE